MADEVGAVGHPDIRDGEILAVVEDGDSVSVILRRRWHGGRAATRSTPAIEVRFVRVKDFVARREAGMVAGSLDEMEGEPPWRRFVFVGSGGSLEVWAQGVEWRDVLRHPCPCCAFRTLDELPPGTHEICPVCGWQDDDVQYRRPDFEAGPNRGKSLNQCRADFRVALSEDPAREKRLVEEWGRG